MNAQSRKTYQKQFEVNKNTILNFDTDNIDVTFKLWDKNEVKIDFSMEFKNYSKKEVKEISNKTNIKVSQGTNMDNSGWLRITSFSEKSITKLSYEIEDGHLYFTDLDLNKPKQKTHKTVKEIHDLLQKKETGFNNFEGYVVFENDSIAVENLEKTNHKGIKSIRSSYVIYLPEYMTIIMKAYRANVKFDGDFNGKVLGGFHDSTLEAKRFTHPENNINFLNGDVKIGYISNGVYTFKNVINGIIAQVNASNIGTEFCKFQIGEIIENTEIYDFKSDIRIYNLGKNFKSIKMNCQYSDIKLFIDKKDDLYMEAIGHNAIMKDGEMKIGLQPNREGKKYKMFTRGDKKTATNVFELDLVHGFITLNYID